MDKKWWTLIAVCAGLFMLLLDVTIVIVALPAIQTGLHASFSDVQWTLDAYALTLAALLLTSRLARRPVRPQAAVLDRARDLHGRLAALRPRGQSADAHRRRAAARGWAARSSSRRHWRCSETAFRGRERGVAFGVWGAVIGVSTALGAGARRGDHDELDWRWIFLVNVPIGVFALAVTIWRVGESAPHARAAGLARLRRCSPPAAEPGVRADPGRVRPAWSDTGVIGCLAAGRGAARAFVVAERRGAHPMFDLSLMRVPTFTGGSIAAFAMNGSLFAMLLYIVIYLQDVLGYSALEARAADRRSSACAQLYGDDRRAAQRPRAGALAGRPGPAARRHRADPHERADAALARGRT